MKKIFLATALLLPLSTFAQYAVDAENYEAITSDVRQRGYLVDYDGQDDKEKKQIKYNSVSVKYVEGSEDLDFYRPRNIEGVSAKLARESRQNHWDGRFIYNPDDPNPNEIRPEEDPLINSGENQKNSLLFNKKRDWLYYECAIPGEYFEYRLSPKLRLQDSFTRTRYCDRYRKSLLQEKRKSAVLRTTRYMRENAVPFVEYEMGDSAARLNNEVSGKDKILKLYGLK